MILDGKQSMNKNRCPVRNKCIPKGSEEMSEVGKRLQMGPKRRETRHRTPRHGEELNKAYRLNGLTKLGDERRSSDGVSFGVTWVRYEDDGESGNWHGNAPVQGFSPE
jgi:hypothetical protein